MIDERKGKKMSIPMRAQALVKSLKLQPHPEGGYYRETYRGAPSAEGGRSTSTMIYFLLCADDRSCFHRIDADEGWHHYEGDPVRIHILEQEKYRWIDVGRLEGECAPQAMIPAGLWFGAEVLTGPHGYALVGCTVAPGFEFSHFELAERELLINSVPKYKQIIERFT